MSWKQQWEQKQYIWFFEIHLHMLHILTSKLKTYSKAHWTIAIFKQNWPNKLLHKINQRSICCSLVIPISQASLIQFVPLYKGKLFYPFLDWDQACYNVLDYWSVLKVIDQSWKMWFCNQFKCTWKRPKLLPGEGGGEGLGGKRKK